MNPQKVKKIIDLGKDPEMTLLKEMMSNGDVLSESMKVLKDISGIISSAIVDKSIVLARDALEANLTESIAQRLLDKNNLDELLKTIKKGV